jgi:hypothetical protein
MPAPNGHGPIDGSVTNERFSAPITFDSNSTTTNATITKSK